MGVKITCMGCGASHTFTSISVAREAKWKFQEAEVGAKTAFITLCPDCNNRTIFEDVVRAKAKATK